MDKITAKYQCPVCKEVYDTEQEASECYQPPPHGSFEEGDIIRTGISSHVYIIKRIPRDNGAPGASLRPYMPYYMAHGIPYKPKPGFYVGDIWCKARKYIPVSSETQSLIEKLRKRLKAAEKLMELTP